MGFDRSVLTAKGDAWTQIEFVGALKRKMQLEENKAHLLRQGLER